ncbi:AsmA family protein [Dongia rigui]|uniref:AsmA family protein n=1 Tax=Dongia rigui TaxID=940149 RepID=A0ABU5DZE2_9PROT|nr:AsmA family protein [Dongia rigui]MDY0872640.1 AsmA family protein [Dongia rigui]
MKFFLRIVLGLVVVILLLIGGAVIWLTQADLKPIAERAASEALGRTVAAESFSVDWGAPLHIELTNLRIANAPWGSERDMITLKSFNADVEPMSLWRGVPVYQHMRAQGLKVVLERDKQGIGNWKFGSETSSGGFALIPKNRTQFPTLLDMVLKDALVTYRTYSGNTLRIQLDNVAIAAPDDVSAVTLKAAGAYNNTPLGLDATTGSFRDMRLADKPFRTDFEIFGKTARLSFKGTQMEPLDFDGVDGQAHLKAEELDNLLASFGADLVADYPLVIDAHLTKKGDHWELTRAKGQLDQGNFSGQLILDEGSKGAPDRVATELSFDRLDVDRLLAGQSSGAEPNLSAPGQSGVVLDAQLRADQFVYRFIRLRDVEVSGHMGPGVLALKSLRFPYAGGRVQASLDVKDRIAATAIVDGVDADKLAREMGAAAGDVTGKISGRIKLDMPSGTLREALGQSQGAAVISMSEGGLRRAILEQMSTDLRSLFREKEGSSPIRCMGGIVILKDGIAVVAPLRLMAKGAILNGGGTIDMAKRQVDLRLRSERKSTGFFALDLPIGISGSFDNLSAGLAGDGAKKWAPPPGPKATALDPDMQKLVSGNPCLN